MFFVEIFKRRGKDFWVVVQGLPLPDGSSTNGEIVYQGPGKLRIAEFVRECHRNYLEAEPDTEGSFHPASDAFGYSSGSALRRYTHEMTFLDSDPDIFAGINLGRINYPQWRLEFTFAHSAAEMDDPEWTRQCWEKIQQGFQYAELFEP